jgi:hypothetical protein
MVFSLYHTRHFWGAAFPKSESVRYTLQNATFFHYSCMYNGKFTVTTLKVALHIVYIV